MRRRDVLRMLAGTFAWGGAGLPGLAAERLARLRSAARRGLRVPSDLMSRIRGRTRPLDERRLEPERDLAG
jgi:hypothetical protein